MDTRGIELKWRQLSASWWSSSGLIWSEENVDLVNGGVHHLDFDRKFCY